MNRTTALAPTAPMLPEQVHQEFERLHGAAVDFEASSASKNTQVCYQRAWVRFEAWCARRGVSSLPATPAVVRLYATDLVTVGVPHANGTPAAKPGGLPTLDLHLAAINYAHEHRFPGQDSPVRGLSKHFRRGLKQKLARPPRKKEWVSAEQLGKFVERFLPTLRGHRDRAMLLVAFDSGGRRRSEVSGMRVEDLRRDARTGDWIWTLPRTKTHMDGFTVVIPSTGGSTCAATALATWLQAAGIKAGPVFRAVRELADGRQELVCREVDGREEGVQPRHLATLVQRAAEAQGLDPKQYGGHSIRAGFLTSMAREGHRLEDLMARSGHQSVDVALGYVRVARMLGEEDPIRASIRKNRRSTEK